MHRRTSRYDGPPPSHSAPNLKRRSGTQPVLDHWHPFKQVRREVKTKVLRGVRPARGARRLHGRASVRKKTKVVAPACNGSPNPVSCECHESVALSDSGPTPQTARTADRQNRSARFLFRRRGFGGSQQGRSPRLWLPPTYLECSAYDRENPEMS